MERAVRQTVRDIALGISQRETNGDSYASDGWFSRFMETNKIWFKRVTNLIALSDDKLLQSQILQSKPQNTILIRGRRLFILKSLDDYHCPCHLFRATGFAPVKISFVLAVQAYGEKVTPLVILKGNDNEIEKKYGLWVVYQTKAWFNQCLLKQRLQLVFPSVFDTVGKLLVWDSCRSQIGQ